MLNQRPGRRPGKFGPSEMRQFGPMDEIVSKKHKAQEGVNRVELARAQVLDVIDMARLAEERLNGLALVVEGKTTATGGYGRVAGCWTRYGFRRRWG